MQTKLLNLRRTGGPVPEAFDLIQIGPFENEKSHPAPIATGLIVFGGEVGLVARLEAIPWPDSNFFFLEQTFGVQCPSYRGTDAVINRRLAVLGGICYLGCIMGAVRSVGFTLDHAAPAISDDHALVTELQAGSEEAFNYLLGIYQQPVFKLILHIVENPADAADVLQDVFVKVFKGIGQFHGESSLKTWIYRIAVHEASNHRRGWLRRLRREPISLDDDGARPGSTIADRMPAAVAPYQSLEQAERQCVVRLALASLAEPYKTVVVLREIEGCSYEEIGQVLRIAEGTVKSRLIRGRELLRRKLNGWSTR
jgi:RNA polymerase sigma-70 factor, ECF subfamily